jgi:hypothetical protein
MNVAYDPEAEWPFFDPETHLVVMAPQYSVDQQLINHLLVDGHMSRRDKATKIAAHTCTVFAKQLGVAPDGLPDEEDFGRDYFALAKLLKDREGRTPVSLILEEMDELADSHGRFSPLGTAKFIESTTHLSQEPKLARFMIVLWYVQYNPDLLSTFAIETLHELSKRPHPTMVAKQAS